MSERREKARVPLFPLFSLSSLPSLASSILSCADFENVKGFYVLSEIADGKIHAKDGAREGKVKEGVPPLTRHFDEV